LVEDQSVIGFRLNFLSWMFFDDVAHY